MKWKFLLTPTALIISLLLGAGVPDYPQFSLRTLDGKSYSSKSLRGSAVLLTFFSRSCPPCKAEVPVLKELVARYGDIMVVLGIGFMEDDPATLASLVKELGITYPVCLDPNGAAARAFNVTVLPKGFLIDHRGKLIAFYNGMAEKNRQDLVKRITALDPEIKLYRAHGPAIYIGTLADADAVAGDGELWRKKISGWLTEKGVRIASTKDEADYIISGNVARIEEIFGVEVIVSDYLGREEMRLSDRVKKGDDARLKKAFLENMAKIPYIPIRK